MLKTEVSNHLQKAYDDLASRQLIEQDDPINSYASLIRRSETRMLEETLNKLTTLNNCVTLAGAQTQFAVVVSELRQKTKEKAHCIFNAPNSPANELCIQLFYIFYPNATVTDFIEMFAPEVERAVLLDFEGHVNRDNKPQPFYKVTVVEKQLSLSKDRLNPFHPQQIIVADNLAFPVPQAMRGDHLLFKHYQSLLSGQYPKIYKQLISFNGNASEIYKKTEFLAHQKPTLRMVLKDLRDKLIVSGTRYTGQEDAGSLAVDAVYQIRGYFNELPEAIRKAYLDIKHNSGDTLRNIINKLNTDPEQCVEDVAKWIDEILANSANKQQLDKHPELDAGAIKEIQQAINTLGRLNQNAFDQPGSTPEQASNSVIFNREGAYYLDIPIAHLESIVKEMKVTHAEALGELLSRFSSSDVYRAICSQVGRWGILKKAVDVVEVLVFLDLQQAHLFLTSAAEDIAKVIKKAKDFRALLLPLSLEQCTTVLASLQAQLPQIIKKGSDFRSVLQFLTPDQRTVVFDSLQAQLPQIIKDGSDLRSVLEFLTPDQCQVVCDSIEEQIPQIIETGDGFREVLKNLTPDQRTAVFDSLQAQLPQIIKNGSDFRSVLEFLTPDQRTVVFDSLQAQLPQIIKNGYGFREVLKNLTPDQRTVVFASLQAQLPKIIKTGIDFGYVLEFLTPDQCQVVCDSLQAQLPQIINDGYWFGPVLKDLTPDQRTVVFASIKAQLPEIIKNVVDVKSVLEFLTPDQCQVVCDSIKEQLPEIIKHGYDFGAVFEDLTPDQCTVVFESFKEQLPKIIKNVSDIKIVLRYLPPEQCEDLFSLLKKQSHTIFTKKESLLKLLDEVGLRRGDKFFSLLFEQDMHLIVDTFRKNYVNSQNSSSVGFFSKNVLTEDQTLSDKDALKKIIKDANQNPNGHSANILYDILMNPQPAVSSNHDDEVVFDR